MLHKRRRTFVVLTTPSTKHLEAHWTPPPCSLSILQTAAEVVFAVVELDQARRRWKQPTNPVSYVTPVTVAIRNLVAKTHPSE